jgi:hypothetical protein
MGQEPPYRGSIGTRRPSALGPVSGSPMAMAQSVHLARFPSMVGSVLIFRTYLKRRGKSRCQTTSGPFSLSN